MVIGKNVMCYFPKKVKNMSFSLLSGMCFDLLWGPYVIEIIQNPKIMFPYINTQVLVPQT